MAINPILLKVLWHSKNSQIDRFISDSYHRFRKFIFYSNTDLWLDFSHSNIFSSKLEYNIEKKTTFHLYSFKNSIFSIKFNKYF
jgi:hypothetical protein